MNFKKSIQLVLRERITSPFSGAFLFSWFVWNWKILYFLFISDDKLHLTDRIEFVNIHYVNWINNLLLPFVSTMFFVLLYPFIITGSLWVSLKFKKWHTDIKNNIEGQSLLTIDQSIALRLEIDNQNQRLDRLTRSKDEEILNLRRENDEIKKRLFEKNEIPQNIISTNINDYSNEITDFMNNQKVQEHFSDVIRFIQGNYRFPNNFPTDVLAYLVGNNILVKKTDKPIYDFTEKGNQFLLAYSKQKNE